MSIGKLLIVKDDFSWTCQVNGLCVPASCSAFSSIPAILSLDDFYSLLSIFFNSSVCPGNKDDRFVEFCHCKKGKFLSIKKDVIAFLDTSDPLVTTVRHSSCDVLVQKESRCSICKSYRTRLRSMLASFRKSKKLLSKTNSRYLNTPQQQQQRQSIRKKVKSLAIQNKRLSDKVKAATEEAGVIVDSELESDLSPVLSDIDSLPLSDFQRLFWEQQVGASF